MELRNYNQFINWVEVPSVRKPGTLDKLPFSVASNSAIDAHNPAQWMTYDQAVATGQKVAFVLSANDPFWCCDLDDCRTPDGSWEQWTQDVLMRFPGAFVEVSHSGTGLHIWGAGTPPANHRSVFTHLGHKVEFYSTGRFIALGHDGVGNIWLDHTAALNAFVPVSDGSGNGTLTNAPVAEYTGPENDGELIALMLAARPSARQAFGQRPTFADLWYGNEKQLGQYYPDDNRPFDHNRADGALLADLAFWTGKDGERIIRLFSMSALGQREKWKDRKDYQIRSTVGAVQKCTNVYNVKREEQRDTPPVQQEVPEGDADPFGEYLTVNQQVEYFAGCVYIQSLHQMFTPKGSMLTPAQFKAMYGGYEFSMGFGSTKTTRDAFEAFTLNTSIKHPKAEHYCFRPDLEPGTIVDVNGVSACNTFIPISAKSEPGNVKPFLDHVAKVLPDVRDQQILVSYMAAMVQNPGLKFKWCIVLQGTEGNGKSFFINVLEQAFTERYTHLPKPEHISNKFNAWLDRKLFIGIEEIYVGDKREMADALKILIDGNRVEVEKKRADQIMVDNRANFLCCTNHQNAILVNDNSRRYCVMFTAQQNAADLVVAGMDSNYFSWLFDWLYNQGGAAHVTHYLQTVEIPDELHPRKGAVRAPRSSTSASVVEASRSTVQLEIIEAIENDLPGFAGGWISSTKLAEFLELKRLAHRVPIQSRKRILEELGYEPHPHLPGGRMTRKLIQESGTKPRLYVKVNSIQAMNITCPYAIMDAYMKAQGYVDIAANAG